MQASSGTTQSSDVKMLCDLLLEVAGRDATRLISVRRHVEVLAKAIPFMADEQASVASSRIRHFETKWGSLLPNSPELTKNGGIAPETVVAHWLSRRRNPERLLKVVRDAAISIANGETRLLDVMDYAYQDEIDRVVRVVGYDSFKEWLTQLRIGCFEPGGRVRPGPLCHWWVEKMAPTGRLDSPYAACLTLLKEEDS